MVGMGGVEPPLTPYQRAVLTVLLHAVVVVVPKGIEPLSQALQASANPSQLQDHGALGGNRTRTCSLGESYSIH